MQTLRKNPPAGFGDVKFESVTDHSTGSRMSIPSGELLAEGITPIGDLLIYRSDESKSVRIQIAGRPSGTEPKIKFYFFCQSDLSDAVDLQSAKQAGDKSLDELKQALGEWANQQLAD